MDSLDTFVEMQKKARFEQLGEQLAPVLSLPWEWRHLFALLTDLGVTNVNQFMSSGWWAPVKAREDEAYGAEIRKLAADALEDGRLPPPEEPYTWDHVKTLGEICGVGPRDMVETLIWVYALTQGEPLFLERLEAAAADVEASYGSD